MKELIRCFINGDYLGLWETETEHVIQYLPKGAHHAETLQQIHYFEEYAFTLFKGYQDELFTRHHHPGIEPDAENYFVKWEKENLITT
jgi:hypothetical protein